ncbi:MAG: porin family protein [Chlamydiales bacterium]|nr:porin family protein [Chlamydiales bacterium]
MKKYLLTLLCLLTFTQAPAQASVLEGTYFGAIGGMNQLKYDQDYFEAYIGYALGGFCGYKFDNGLRLEGEVSFRRNKMTDSFMVIDDFNEINVDLEMQTKITSVMANALYEFCPRSICTPYFGLGIGYAHISQNGFLEALGGRAVFRGDTDQFAWQAILGLNRRLTPDCDFAVEYRYLNPGAHLENHGVVLSLKRFF